MTITYIPQAAMSFVARADVTYDFKMLGPRQKPAFMRALRSGITFGNAAYVNLIKTIREDFGRSHLAVSRRGRELVRRAQDR
jgi:hypothetical protein